MTKHTELNRLLTKVRVLYSQHSENADFDKVQESG